MARNPRLDLPGIPQRVLQRGNDRQAGFAAKADVMRYLQELREASAKYDCAVHAYVRTTNRVPLLATPAAAGAISRMMQGVGRRYVDSFDARYRPTGTLWKGRLKAALVDTDRYLLTCYRYIELNTVRAWMITIPPTTPGRALTATRWSNPSHSSPRTINTRYWPVHLPRQGNYLALVHQQMEKNPSTKFDSTTSNSARG